MTPETTDSLDDDSLKRLVLQLLAQNKGPARPLAELEAKSGQPPKTPSNSSLPPSRGQNANVGEPLWRKKKCARQRRRTMPTLNSRLKT
jgi:hypothetical protein